MTFKKKFENKIKTIKSGTLPDTKTNIHFKHLDSAYTFYPITKNFITKRETIIKLALWRDCNQKFFPSQFRVTIAGTKKWTKSEMMQKSDRILFFLKKDSKALIIKILSRLEPAC